MSSGKRLKEYMKKEGKEKERKYDLLVFEEIKKI